MKSMFSDHVSSTTYNSVLNNYNKALRSNSISVPSISQRKISDPSDLLNMNSEILQNDTSHCRKFEEFEPDEWYMIMLKDEKFPVKPTNIKYFEEVVNVHRFYFKEARKLLKQRTRTLHLAMDYF